MHALAPIAGLRSHGVEDCGNLDVTLAQGDDVVLGAPATLVLASLVACRRITEDVCAQRCQAQLPGSHTSTTNEEAVLMCFFQQAGSQSFRKATLFILSAYCARTRGQGCVVAT